jgi:hypothetical protein
MTHDSRIEQIRAFVEQRLRAWGTNADQVLAEAVLIRDERYCGHRFQFGEYAAVWFVEENELKIYGSSGQILEVLDSSPENLNLNAISRAA